MSTICRVLGSSVLMVVATACGSDSPGPGNGGGGGGGGNCPANSICMTSSLFSPTSRTVAANAPVTWTNNSTTLHNVTFSTPTAALAVGAGGSGDFNAPASSSSQRQFAAAGSYAFHCTIHGTATSGMRGTVVVQ